MLRLCQSIMQGIQGTERIGRGETTNEAVSNR